MQLARGRRYITEELADSLAASLTGNLDAPAHEVLSDREFQTLCLIAAGKTLAQIGDELAVSPKTISVYRARLLAKLNLADPGLIDVFELCIGGMEVAPAYSEQNDPFVQRAMFEAQVGEETQKMDTDFLLALEHGMPPAGGMGVGIDRLCILLTGAESIRDVILFPSLRPTEAKG